MNFIIIRWGESTGGMFPGSDSPISPKNLDLSKIPCPTFLVDSEEGDE